MPHAQPVTGIPAYFAYQKDLNGTRCLGSDELVYKKRL